MPVQCVTVGSLQRKATIPPILMTVGFYTASITRVSDASIPPATRRRFFVR